MDDLIINQYLTIPGIEIAMETSRSGGAGGQHVNKTDTRVTLRWNILESVALNEKTRMTLLEKFSNKLTTSGELIVHCMQTRSQADNKRLALEQLALEVRKALYVSKKRIATKIPRSAKVARCESKKRRSAAKKLRSKKIDV